ncbi:hypothetical protein Pmani_008554 [Petrolisthes manimaculis]|uniref:Uncharacterized protein n=1 Tax=Petrolisthes manimaculis TaxID=1843537 RepID=A0AAE1Q6P4_9EUCA|nr:hypothetical protein Pmani_008554 [Petrolisthes manimaculis]
MRKILRVPNFPPTSSHGDFICFKSSWQDIDKTTYEDSSTDDYTAKAVAEFKDEMVQMLEMAVKVKQPRDDYRELLELTIIFLGVVLPQGIHFAAPGAMHQALWMAKVIYTFKVWMFRAQFNLTSPEHKELRELCIFFSCIYVEAWMTASIASKAPRNYLKLLKQCQMYQKINTNISRATVKKMAGQLWYLSEQLVTLALFDDDLDNNTKDKMVLAMKEREGEKKPPKRATVDIKLIKEKTLVDFTIRKSKTFFNNLHLPQDFLEYPADQWKHQPSFSAPKSFVSTLAVTNDHAERAIALVEHFSGHLTKDEQQLQFVLSVVAEHRKKCPDARKQTLLGNNE